MTLHLKVKPGSKIDALFFDDAGQLNAKIKAPPQDGKANAYLLEFLGKQLGIAKSKITILAGFSSQFKKLDIEVEEKVVEVFLKKIKLSAVEK